MKILLVDDDLPLLEALAAGLQHEWQDSDIVTATDGHAALERFYNDEPDVVVLDLVIPEKSGFEVLQEIRRVSDVPVVIFTARDGEIDQVRGLELGADRYLTKPISQPLLRAHVEAVLRRSHLPPPIPREPDFEAGDLCITFQNRQVTLRGEPVKLTPVEYQLLFHLIQNAGRVLPHEVLVRRVWGASDGATTDHVKAFVSRLRAKIEPDPAGPRFIETARGLGYRFVRPSRAESGPDMKEGPVGTSRRGPGLLDSARPRSRSGW
jgi:two-component system KDP operon response regulator KdpE